MLGKLVNAEVYEEKEKEEKNMRRQRSSLFWNRVKRKRSIRRKWRRARNRGKKRRRKQKKEQGQKSEILVEMHKLLVSWVRKPRQQACLG